MGDSQSKRPCEESGSGSRKSLASSSGGKSRGSTPENPLVTKADIVSHLAELVADNEYLFFASVCRGWKDAWVRRPTATQGVTPHTSVSQLLRSFDCGLQRKSAISDAAARLGRIDLLQSARESGCPWSASTIRWAAWGGHLDLIEWAIASGCPFDKDACSWAAFRGHLTVVQWMLGHGCAVDASVCAEAARGGHFEILKWAWRNGCPCDVRTTANAVDHPEILMWVVQNRFLVDASACATAAMRGDLGVLQWCRAQGCPWDEDTCRAAAWKGHLSVLQWCRAHGCPWNEETIEYAADSGHNHVVAWCRDNDAPEDDASGDSDFDENGDY